MTREEAIKALELINLDRIHPFLSWEEMMEVRDISISALRAQPEKLDRSRWVGCPCCWKPECDCCAHAARREELDPCKSCVKGYQESEGEECPGYVAANYCHHCGRPLTEEAWADLERRIGGNNGTTD